MTAKEILELAKLGYSKEDVKALCGIKTEPKEGQKEQKEPKNETIDLSSVLSAITELKSTIQTNNRKTAEQPNGIGTATDESLIDVLFGKKGE